MTKSILHIQNQFWLLLEIVRFLCKNSVILYELAGFLCKNSVGAAQHSYTMI